MKASLEGRLRNLRLHKTNYLLPLFEAIINSIDSLREVDSEVQKTIDITVIRNLSQPTLPLGSADSEDIHLQPIQAFKVTDNGVGFTDENFDSFCTFDSPKKLSSGGKGIGRLTWLKAFSSVKIDSIYKVNGDYYKRSFDFIPNGEGIANKFVSSEYECQNCRTTVTLSSFHEDYAKHCPCSIDEIADRIIDHCIIYFIFSDCPAIIISDSNSSVSLNERFQARLKNNVSKDRVMLDDYIFDLFHVKHMDGPHPGASLHHRIVYCAHRRVVKSEYLEGQIPDLAKKLKDKEGRGYFYSVFVSGKYLDDNVNADRTNFAFMEDMPLLEAKINASQIISEIVNKSKHYLKDDLLPVQADKFEQYSKYISDHAPQYRVLLKHYADEIRKLPPGLSNQNLDHELYKIKAEITLRVRERGRKFLKRDPRRAQDVQTYKDEYQKYLAEENDIGKSSLAEYIAHRRIILDLFNNLLKRKGAEYSPEEDVHRIIYPLKATSEDVDWEDQNLWIIDERLSYHQYLASDKPLNESCATDSKKRPDIIIYNTHAFTDKMEHPFSSIFLIEFKKPGPIDTSRDLNPIEQLYRYVRIIREGKAKDKDGRPITVSNDTAFYAYLICDVDENIITYANNADLNKTPDGFGYFGYNKNHRVYIEIVPFTKLSQDAEKRNKVLFDRLCI